MGVNHVIRRGDSLYGLAGRYLGNFNRWPEIYAFHNEQVKLHGPGNKALIPIKNADKIYVGQVLVIPGRGQHPKGKVTLPAGAAKPTKAATPVDLTTKYYIGPPTTATPATTPTPTATPTPAPAGSKKSGGGSFGVPLDLKSENAVPRAIRYAPFVTPDYTMITEMSGEITLENLSPDRHQSNWELAISDDKNTLGYKLRQAHDKAFLELTGGMGMAFDPKTNRAILRPSIAVKAGLGPYELEVKADGPNHFSSTLKLEALSGRLEDQGRVFKFTASVAINIDVTIHPAPKGQPENPLFDPKSDVVKTKQADNFSPKTGVLVKVGIAALIVVGVVILIFTGGGAAIRATETSFPRLQPNPAMGGSPYLHTIYPNGNPNA